MSTTISVCFLEAIKEREFWYALVNRHFALHLYLNITDGKTKWITQERFTLTVY